MKWEETQARIEEIESRIEELNNEAELLAFDIWWTKEEQSKTCTVWFIENNT